LSYSAALDKNNDRAWFHANHSEYEKARADFTELLEMMRFAIADASPELAKDIMHMNVKDWMYRIARDARIYKTAPPYDPAFRAYISTDRRSWQPIGYFIRIFPGDCLFGTGLRCFETSDMNRVRVFLAENYDEYMSIVAETGVELTGERLKKVPLGYSQDHPAAELIKCKNWVTELQIPDRRLTTFRSFSNYIKKNTANIEPMRKFLLRAAHSTMTERPWEL
ncbi:MAG: DUF2461 domain-containing protein, partial [Oscillospiraceae bacterium]|nr:DUF2461 domain-containing protein [Oscillospiraceae bacterium]